jgi:N-acetylglucosamine kinase-like BadF-type ATPase
VQAVLGARRARRRIEAPVPRRGGAIDVAALCALVEPAVAEAIAEAGARRADAICVGTTGMPDLVEDPAEFRRLLQRRLGTLVVAVAGDVLTTHLGALGGQPGAVVAAGTGAVALGTDHREIWNRVDGWGPFLGDEGGGAWIGARGLSAALRAEDGRGGGSPGTLTLIRRRFGAPEDLVRRIHSAQSPPQALASFAPLVADAARSGDGEARAIWDEAGFLLARSAVAATRGVPRRVSWGGGLFRVGALLLDPFRAAVVAADRTVAIEEPLGDALDGAALLAGRLVHGEPPVGEGIARSPHLRVFGAG